MPISKLRVLRCLADEGILDHRIAEVVHHRRDGEHATQSFVQARFCHAPPPPSGRAARHLQGLRVAARIGSYRATREGNTPCESVRECLPNGQRPGCACAYATSGGSSRLCFADARNPSVSPFHPVRCRDRRRRAARPPEIPMDHRPRAARRRRRRLRPPPGSRVPGATKACLLDRGPSRSDTMGSSAATTSSCRRRHRAWRCRSC